MSAHRGELKARGLPWVANNVETPRITDQLCLPPWQPRSNYLWPPRNSGAETQKGSTRGQITTARSPTGATSASTTSPASSTRPRLRHRGFYIERVQAALFGYDAMSNLSPLCAPKRTTILSAPSIAAAISSGIFGAARLAVETRVRDLCEIHLGWRRLVCMIRWRWRPERSGHISSICRG